MDKDAYMLKPEVNSGQCLEHTRATLEKESLSRSLGGTIVGNGAWVHCDVLPKGKEKYEFNSYMAPDVKQAKGKPAEDKERLEVMSAGAKVTAEKLYASSADMKSVRQIPKAEVKCRIIAPEFKAADAPKSANRIKGAGVKKPREVRTVKEKAGATEKKSVASSDMAVAKRRFVRENGRFWKDICETGQAIEYAARDAVDADGEAATETARQFRYKTTDLMEYLSASGARSVYEMTLTRATNVAEATAQAEMLIKDGKLTLSDLAGKGGSVKDKLKIVGVKSSTVKHIVRNQELVKSVLETKQIFLDFSMATGRFDETMVNFINSKDIFQHELFSGEFKRAAGIYFQASGNELLRSINPANMTAKEIGKLIKNPEKYDISVQDMSVLKVLHQNMLSGKAKAVTKYAYGVSGRIKDGWRFFSIVARKMNEEPVALGVRKIYSVYNGTRAAYHMFRFTERMSFKTIRFAGRGVFLNPVSRYAGQKVRQGAKVLKDKASTAIKATDTVKKVTKTANRIKGAVNKNEKVVKVKKIAEQVKSKTASVKVQATRLNNKRRVVSRRVKSAKNKAMRVAKTPVNILTKPFSIFGIGTLRLKEFLMNKLILPLAGGFLIFIMIYFLLIVVSGLCLSMLQKSKEVIFLEREELQELVDYVDGLGEAVYEEAYEIAIGTPISDEVYNNVSLYYYGSPKSANDPTSDYYHHGGASVDEDLLNGWHIYYLDSNGSVIGEQASNTKDIISLATVMMSNNSDDYDEYKHLIDDMWCGMVPVITAKESEIYHTEYSTDTYPFDGSSYYCNKASFYNGYNSASGDGVCFYENPISQKTATPTVYGYHVTGKGCDYTEWYELELDCNRTEDDHIHTEENGCYEKEWYRNYYCSGHDALHCSYGYRDINIYITLLTKEDYFSGTTSESSTIMTYKVPTNFEATEFEEKTAVVNYKMHLDGYRKRMKDFFANGAWDYTNHLLHASVDEDTGELSCDIPRVNADGSVSQGSEERCAGNIEWCNSIYHGDWSDVLAGEERGTSQ